MPAGSSPVSRSLTKALGFMGASLERMAREAGAVDRARGAADLVRHVSELPDDDPHLAALERARLTIGAFMAAVDAIADEALIPASNPAATFDYLVEVCR
jgi:hypothetical protein